MSRLSIKRCERGMKPMRRLWLGLAAVFVLSLAALGWLGREIYLAAPPIPEVVRTKSGETLFTGEQIRDGQQLGSVWGHGAYVAPDWPALHLERYALLTPTQRASVDALVEQQIRANTFEAGLRRIAMESRR